MVCRLLGSMCLLRFLPSDDDLNPKDRTVPSSCCLSGIKWLRTLILIDFPEPLPSRSRPALFMERPCSSQAQSDTALPASIKITRKARYLFGRNNLPCSSVAFFLSGNQIKHVASNAGSLIFVKAGGLGDRKHLVGQGGERNRHLHLASHV